VRPVKTHLARARVAEAPRRFVIRYGQVEIYPSLENTK